MEKKALNIGVICSPNIKSCKLGKVQSPVNLEADNGIKVANKPLKMNYFPAAYQVENNGHTVQVSVAQENAPFINAQQ